MKANNTISETRQSGAKLTKESNGRTAVIVLTPYSARKANYGIQFWTPEMIAAGTAKNSDNTISTFIENL